MRRFLPCIMMVFAMLAAPAAVAADDEPRMIVAETVVEAPADQVWGAWTSAEGVRSWLGVSSKIELRPNGPFELYFAPDSAEGERGSEGCVVLAYVPARMLSFTWNAPPHLPNARRERTMVVVDFDAIGEDRTRVTLRHHAWPEGEAFNAEWEQTFKYFQNAWPHVLKAVAAHFDADADEPPRDPMQGWTYLIRLTDPGLLESATPEQQATFAAHFAYLSRLTREGRVVFAGPCTDMIGPGIVIFEAADEAEAASMMNADPAVAAGLFVAELHPIRFSLLRERDRR